MASPDLWIIAGPNGAGKTTLVSRGRESFGIPAHGYINPDAITLEYLKEHNIQSWREAPPALLKETFIRAAKDAQILLEKRIESGEIAIIETVLSTEKYQPLVKRVHKLGGRFRLIYVALDSPDKSRERVRIRVGKGGHDVPDDKLVSRWTKSLELLPWFAWHADEFWIIDNSPPEKVSQGHLLVSGSDRCLHVHGLPAGNIRPVVAEFLARFCDLNTNGEWRLDFGDTFAL